MRIGLSKMTDFCGFFNELSAFRFGSRDPPGCASQRPNRKPPQRRQSTPRQEKALLRRLTAASKLAAVPIGRLQLLRVALTAEFLDLRPRHYHGRQPLVIGTRSTVSSLPLSLVLPGRAILPTLHAQERTGGRLCVYRSKPPAGPAFPAVVRLDREAAPSTLA
jgi:hypothetical protein